VLVLLRDACRPIRLCRAVGVRALLRMRTDQRVPHCGSSLNRCRGPNLTMSNSPSRSRGALFAPGVLQLLLRQPRIEGWAERRETFGCVRSTRGARHLASKTRVNALMTRHARRLARRLASHNAGRSPLGAPPWRFWALGPRFRLPHYTGAAQRAPRSQVVVPGGRGPAPPEASSYEPPPQDATPRSAFRIVSGDAPR
jgi:hypothetical protein